MIEHGDDQQTLGDVEHEKTTIRDAPHGSSLTVINSCPIPRVPTCSNIFQRFEVLAGSAG